MKEIVKKQNKVFKTSFVIMTLVSIALLLIIIFSSDVFGYASPTGIVQYTPTIYLAWNNGSIENETYFNKTSGLVQHANFLRGLDDIKYVYGIGAKVGNTISLIMFDALPGNITTATDNLTYWRASSHMNRTVGSDWYYIRKDNGQRVNDDYVHMDYVLATNNPSNRVFYLATGIRQMDINNDGIYERISIVNATDVITWDNRTGSRTWYNISRITIDGSAYTFDIYFPKPVEVRYNHSSKSTNGDFLFLQELGQLNASTFYTHRYDWIDATCVITCAGNCTLDINTNATGGTAQQMRSFANIGCRTQNGAACGITPCTHSTSCVLEWVHDYPELDGSTWRRITANNNETPLECGSGGATCARTNPVRGTYYYSTLNTSRSSFPSGVYTNFVCAMQLTSGSWKTSKDLSGFDYEYNVTPIEINITLGNPQNPWLLNNTINWAVFMINQSRYNVTKYDNISLVLNGSINATSAPNLTANVSFTSNGVYNWTGLACFRYNCQYAWNGNKSISQQTTSSTTSIIRKFISYLIDRSII